MFAIAAAALYAINVPFSKLLLGNAAPAVTAAFLYLGAGIGMLMLLLFQKAIGRPDRDAPLTRRELPYTVAMILLDVAAPILLMAGIARSNPAHVSLLNNFEIVATSLIALLLFKESVSRRLWLAIGLIVAASLLLSFEGHEGLVFNEGSLLALGACLCWGLENNCTRKLSEKSSSQIVAVKGIGSGTGSLIVALLMGESFPSLSVILLTLLLGFVAYGLSIKFYVMAQKDLGAAKTSAYYSIAPFLGVFFSFLILQELPGPVFYLALALMIAATLLIVRDTFPMQHAHTHTHVHCHAHRHGDLVHTHSHAHTHTHDHIHDGDERVHGHSHTDTELPDHLHSHTI